MISTIFTIYGLFALAMAVVVWPMLKAAALTDRRDEIEQRGIKRLREQ
ncbi:hypothetical protein [Paraburkholderia elongata]|uniref:Heme exporter protein D n=1 Tax=Paraburkholderia elongata TaxID=2675747 RepID=A0A972SLE5_9BURK|nr:hypothetical protein [Paraburkholderia elongata]NPT59052.1 hypothetical protein [Paraburkholderia elongata]